ncbi:MAG: DNA repair protein RecO [Bacteroidota bacterium]
MLLKTKGIVLHSFKYSEKSIIINTYTDTLGLQSYIIKSARSRKSRMKAGNFQPLSILDIVAYQGKKQGMHHIKEITSCRLFEQIPYDMKKSAVVFFIAELLYKTLREDSPNKNLFDFIAGAVETIDKTNDRISDFHLLFMMELSRHLGFFPRNNFDKQHTVFNLMDGVFQERMPEHPYFADEALSSQLHILLNASFDNFAETRFPSCVRHELVQKMMDYYQIHINGFTVLNSHVVLEEVFN